MIAEERELVLHLLEELHRFGVLAERCQHARAREANLGLVLLSGRQPCDRLIGFLPSREPNVLLPWKRRRQLGRRCVLAPAVSADGDREGRAVGASAVGEAVRRVRRTVLRVAPDEQCRKEDDLTDP
jgi:hypothetical protein